MPCRVVSCPSFALRFLHRPSAWLPWSPPTVSPESGLLYHHSTFQKSRSPLNWSCAFNSTQGVLVSHTAASRDAERHHPVTSLSCPSVYGYLFNGVVSVCLLALRLSLSAQSSHVNSRTPSRVQERLLLCLSLSLSLATYLPYLPRSLPTHIPTSTYPAIPLFLLLYLSASLLRSAQYPYHTGFRSPPLPSRQNPSPPATFFPL